MITLPAKKFPSCGVAVMLGSLLAGVCLWPVTLLGATLSGPWWKGNLHTHTLWSDGDQYPEMVVAWYKTNGYHFLALSDHNTLQEGDRWIPIDRNKGGREAFSLYRDAFGPGAIDTRQEDGREMVRLKTLIEMRPHFEEPERFLLLAAEEITDQFQERPIHLNAYPVTALIPPQQGTSVLDVIQRNVDAVLDQRRGSHLPIIVHLNHPNFGYAVPAEDLMRVRGERFFEVYNGHPDVRNEGDDRHPSVERIWDIALAFRLTVWQLDPLFGLAVDDAHNYQASSVRHSNPGRGWIMVQSPRLEAKDLIEAMEAGRFYASSGVVLERIRATRSTLSLVIRREAGVTYRTQFVGTRHGFNPASFPHPERPEAMTRRYSDEIGEIFAEVPGLKPSYELDGDELYVRAKVISSKRKVNPYRDGEFEAAWVQPLIRQ